MANASKVSKFQTIHCIFDISSIISGESQNLSIQLPFSYNSCQFISYVINSVGIYNFWSSKTKGFHLSVIIDSVGNHSYVDFMLVKYCALFISLNPKYYTRNHFSIVYNRWILHMPIHNCINIRKLLFSHHCDMNSYTDIIYKSIISHITNTYSATYRRCQNKVYVS